MATDTPENPENVVYKDFDDGDNWVPDGFCKICAYEEDPEDPEKKQKKAVDDLTRLEPLENTTAKKNLVIRACPACDPYLR